MSDTQHVKGLSALNAMLQSFPAKLEQNVLRGAMRAGAKVVLPVAKANAPRDTGEMADDMKVSVSAKRGRVTGKVKLTGKHAFLGNWLEHGVAAHQISAKSGGWLFLGNGFAKSVLHPGIKPHPFMRPALDTQATASVVAIGNYIKDRLASKHGLDTADIQVEAEES